MDSLKFLGEDNLNSCDIMIDLDDVHLTLPSEAGPIDILRGVGLSVARGDAVGLVGPSGSGKSTLLAVMAGLERPGRGRVQVAGRYLETMGEDDLTRFRRDHVGIVFQSFHLIPTMTALENVALPLEFSGIKDPFTKAENALSQVQMDDRLSHYPSQLSGGEQQRVALARAVVHRPSLLLADEPTGNLDGSTGGAIVDLMFELHEITSSTLVLITHDQALTERCDRIVHMNDGRLTEGPGIIAAGPSA